jgi:hypothetical protein
VAKVYKPNFIYVKSILLKQEVAFSKKTGWVHCEDGVKYSPQELELIEKAGGVLDAVTHNIKKIFGGEIVEVKNVRHSTDKAVESGQRAGNAKNTDTDKKVSGVNGTCAESRDGELEIY